MMTLLGHFDGKVIVLDDPRKVSLPSGTRLRVNVETVEELGVSPTAPRRFQPLNICIRPDLAHAIASDRAFNIEEA